MRICIVATRSPKCKYTFLICVQTYSSADGDASAVVPVPGSATGFGVVGIDKLHQPYWVRVWQPETLGPPPPAKREWLQPL